jgi:integrase
MLQDRRESMAQVFKREWQNKDGTISAAWLAEYFDNEGKRRYKAFAKKAHADAYLLKVAGEVAAGRHVAPRKSITVSEAAENWIKRVEAHGAERSTIRQYRQHKDLHIVPKIGKIKLSALTNKIIEDFANGLLKDLKRPMARKVLTSFKSILKVAKVSHLADDVSIGRDKRKPKLEAGRDFPTPAEVGRLVETAQQREDKGRTYALVLTAITTGLRASELRGLRWTDVDFKAGDLHVRQRADRFNRIGPPKSDAGTRTVSMAPELVSALKAWKLACPKGDENLVFPSSTGHIEHHKNMLVSLGQVMHSAHVVDKDGEPKYALHALRHLFASWCINPKSRGGRELPVKEVQELLGHGSVVMTLDVYGHMFPKREDKGELAAASALLLSGS